MGFINGEILLNSFKDCLVSKPVQISCCIMQFSVTGMHKFDAGFFIFYSLGEYYTYGIGVRRSMVRMRHC
jgi:hypothetical protein